jgi:hypothetical protein
MFDDDPRSGDDPRQRDHHTRDRDPIAAIGELPRVGERVGDAQLDKRLSSHADSLGLAVDRAKQIDGEIDVHTLDLAARARGACQIKMRAEVFPRVVHLVETSGAQRPSL